MAIKVEKRRGKGGTRYLARYETPDGSWLSAGTYADEEEARYEARKAEEESRKANWIDPRKGKGSFAAFIEDTYMPTTKVLEKSTQDTTKWYVNKYILPTFGDKQIAEIKPSHVQRWVSGWAAEGTHAPATILRTHSLLHRIFGWAVKDGVIATNPCAETDLPPIPQRDVVIMLPEEFDAIWEQLRMLRDKTMVLLAIETGMRWSELQAFTPGQILVGNRIRIDRGLVEVSAKMNGSRWARKPYPKGKTQRTVTISDECMTLLNQYIVQTAGQWCICCPRGDRSEMEREIFLTATGRHYSRTDFRRDVWRKAVVAAGLGEKKYTMKHLRSSFCSWMLAGDVPVVDVQALMGHKSLDTTQRYVQVLPEAEKAAATALQALRAARRRAS